MAPVADGGLVVSVSVWYTWPFLQVCIDVFLGGQQYMDTATISQLPKVTGGQMHFYRGFSVGLWPCVVCLCGLRFSQREPALRQRPILGRVTFSSSKVEPPPPPFVGAKGQ